MGGLERPSSGVGVRVRDGVSLDVDEQHRDDGDDVSAGTGGAVRAGARSTRTIRAFLRYAMAMMLVTSFAATIGGMGTPVGTPPNLIGRRTAQNDGRHQRLVPRLDARRRAHRDRDDGVPRDGVSGAEGARRAPEPGSRPHGCATSCASSGRMTVGERNVVLRVCRRRLRCGCCPACSASRSASARLRHDGSPCSFQSRWPPLWARCCCW